jgi:ABC-type transport system involved in cytochrome bd biosynthesis fused ATPase/permease subunit
MYYVASTFTADLGQLSTSMDVVQVIETTSTSMAVLLVIIVAASTSMVVLLVIIVAASTSMIVLLVTTSTAMHDSLDDYSMLVLLVLEATSLYGC